MVPTTEKLYSYFFAFVSAVAYLFLTLLKENILLRVSAACRYCLYWRNVENDGFIEG